MSDRTEQLLAELVDLQRRSIAHQEQSMAQYQEAMTRQERALALQAEGVARQRFAMRMIWVLMALGIACYAVPLLINMTLRPH
jgi:hypothetical protein